MIKLQLLFASILTISSTQAYANAMDDLTASLASDPKPALSIITLPANPGDKDKEAATIISNASIVPITRGVFPQYRARALDEERLDITAWSLADYKKYQALGARSEPCRRLLVEQTMALQTAIGGSNNNGAIAQLRGRAAGIPAKVKQIDIDGDNVDSLQKAAPPAWQSVHNDFKQVAGNHAKALDIAKLKAQFGEVEAQKFLERFSRLESEKGRPHEVWMFGLEGGNGDLSWINILVSLKAKLKPLGYEAFALAYTPQRKFFTNLNQAQLFAKTLRPQAHAQIVEEGPAILVLDKDARVVNATGKVTKRDLDPETKKRVEGMQQVMNFGNRFLGKSLVNGTFDGGPRFQFVNYPANWFPPLAKIDTLDNDQLKISVPVRFSVCYAYQGAFAIKDFDQYRYMDAEGVNAINYGMSHKDVENHLKQLDRAYGLNVISARYDGLTAKYLNLPSDLNSLAKQEKSFCPDMEESETLKELKVNGVVHYWWD